jgi:hypothetical protein
MNSLRDDLLPTLESMAEYTGHPVRRVRHLIDNFGFPAKKVGGRWESRRSWIDQFYSTTDAAERRRAA